MHYFFQFTTLVSREFSFRWSDSVYIKERASLKRGYYECNYPISIKNYNFNFYQLLNYFLLLDLVGEVIDKKSIKNEHKDKVDKKDAIVTPKHHSMPDSALKALTKLLLAKNKKSTDFKQANKRESVTTTGVKRKSMSDDAFMALTKLLPTIKDIVDKKSANQKQAKKESVAEVKLQHSLSKKSSDALVKLMSEKEQGEKRDLKEKDTQKSLVALNQLIFSDQHPVRFTSLSDVALDHLIDTLTGKQQRQQATKKSIQDEADRKEIGEIMKLLKTDSTAKGIQNQGYCILWYNSKFTIKPLNVLHGFKKLSPSPEHLV